MTEIFTRRLRLSTLQDHHRDGFAQMHADPEVMADLGGPIDEVKSLEKFDRYLQAYQEYDTARWAVEDLEGQFLGYCGVMPRAPASDHPLGFHYEIGWRFRRDAWGHGYATESAQASLHHAVGQKGLREIIAYTGPDNLRSQAVMKRLDLRRTFDKDFSFHLGDGLEFPVLVWSVPIERYE